MMSAMVLVVIDVEMVNEGPGVYVVMTAFTSSSRSRFGGSDSFDISPFLQ
jgi:hypothetical protein